MKPCTLVLLGLLALHCGDGFFGVAFVRPTMPMYRQNTMRISSSRPMSRISMSTPGATAEAVDLSGDGGVVREMVAQGQGKGLMTGDIATVKFTGTVAETGQVFTKGNGYRTTLEDGTMISGWDTGLAGLRPGDRAIIRCTSRYGYGSEGVAPVIPPNANLIFNVELMENEGNIMNPATFVDANPLTPRTPQSIADAFSSKNQQRMASRADQEDLEGLDKAIAWIKSIYVFGLFEGETGQEAPWYLKPLITFPIMISICAVAFYVVLLFNGITTDRGTGAVQDDPMLASLYGAEALRQWGELVA